MVEGFVEQVCLLSPEWKLELVVWCRTAEFSQSALTETNKNCIGHSVRFILTHFYQ